ncbi:MAG: GntR family transcriptional regulator [Rhizobiaceae bacterium]
MRSDISDELSGRPRHRNVAYDKIRAALSSGTIKNGEAIRERDISAWLNLGRTPVREALKRLEVEKILSPTPDGGLEYRVMTQTEVMEVFAITTELTSLALRSAAHNVSPVEIEAMRALLDQFLQNIEADQAVVLRLAHRLDEVIYAAARNRLLLEQLTTLRDRLTLRSQGRSTLAHMARRRDFYEDTKAVVEALAVGDGQAAEKAGRARHHKGAMARMELGNG